MTKNWRKAGILLTLTLAIAACANQAPVENISNEPVPSGPHKLSQKEVGTVIARTAVDLGWTVQQTRPGLYHIKIVRHDNQFEAEADVNYSASSYSITLTSSQNMQQQGNMISASYNRWADHLKTDIDKNLNVAVFQ